MGIIGNRLGRNTIYIKKITLTKIFTTFYNLTSIKLLKKLQKKYTKTFSNIYNNLSKILNHFENRLDITLYRTGLIPHIKLAKTLIFQGYITIN